jgi:two-component system, NtrC family, nitrogen regulation sensor histidine kinase GlnL
VKADETEKTLNWRDVVESLPDAVIVVSGTLQPLGVNTAAETMLGASQLSHSTFRDILKQNEWLASMVNTCLETGQELGDPDTVLTIGPREVTVRADVSPLMSLGDKPRGAAILLHDLAHQKSAAEAASRGDLSLRLSPAGLAHEVKNPLTGIKGAGELLAAMFPSDERAQQYCGLILDGVNRIASLVEQVLTVSSPQRLAQEPVNIHQILHQALRLAGLFEAPESEIEIAQDFDPSLPEVLGDAAALERAFLNLIKNAAEALGGRRGKIRLHTRIETQFRMTNKGRRMQFLRVEVADSGPGMSAEAIAQLFTPFFTTKPAGTGLGLVLSQRIVALHGGRLWGAPGGVKIKDGGPGMTFRVTLPIMRPSRATPR